MVYIYIYIHLDLHIFTQKKHLDVTSPFYHFFHQTHFLRVGNPPEHQGSIPGGRCHGRHIMRNATVQNSLGETVQLKVMFLFHVHFGHVICEYLWCVDGETYIDCFINENISWIAAREKNTKKWQNQGLFESLCRKPASPSFPHKRQHHEVQNVVKCYQFGPTKGEHNHTMSRLLRPGSPWALEGMSNNVNCETTELHKKKTWVRLTQTLK